MIDQQISKNLRDYCNKLRSKPIPLSELIPLLQKSADRIDALESQLEALKQYKVDEIRVNS